MNIEVIVDYAKQHSFRSYLGILGVSFSFINDSYEIFCTNEEMKNSIIKYCETRQLQYEVIE